MTTYQSLKELARSRGQRVLETISEFERRTGRERNVELLCAAANIRRELAAAFPGAKFSVKTETFSMGDKIRIDLKHGAGVDRERVRSMTKKYASYVPFGYGIDGGCSILTEFHKEYGAALFVSVDFWTLEGPWKDEAEP